MFSRNFLRDFGCSKKTSFMVQTLVSTPTKGHQLKFRSQLAKLDFLVFPLKSGFIHNTNSYQYWLVIVFFPLLVINVFNYFLDNNH